MSVSVEGVASENPSRTKSRAMKLNFNREREGGRERERELQQFFLFVVLFVKEKSTFESHVT